MKKRNPIAIAFISIYLAFIGFLFIIGTFAFIATTIENVFGIKHDDAMVFASYIMIALGLYIYDLWRECSKK